MTSTMLTRFQLLLDAGLSKYDAVGQMASEYGLDAATVSRVIGCAEKDEATLPNSPKHGKPPRETRRPAERRRTDKVAGWLTT